LLLLTEILQKDFLEGLGVSQYRLALDIEVPPRRINEIVHGLRGISPDTALRLARYFRTTPQFWMNLQMRYDLQKRRRSSGRTPASDQSSQAWRELIANLQMREPQT